MTWAGCFDATAALGLRVRRSHSHYCPDGDHEYRCEVDPCLRGWESACDRHAPPRPSPRPRP